MALNIKLFIKLILTATAVAAQTPTTTPTLNLAALGCAPDLPCPPMPSVEDCDKEIFPTQQDLKSVVLESTRTILVCPGKGCHHEPTPPPVNECSPDICVITVEACVEGEECLPACSAHCKEKLICPPEECPTSSSQFAPSISTPVYTPKPTARPGFVTSKSIAMSTSPVVVVSGASERPQGRGVYIGMAAIFIAVVWF